MTNAHVVEGASRVSVTLTDGRRFRAVVAGIDEIVDVAVLRMIPPGSSEEDSLSSSSSSSSTNVPVDDDDDRGAAERAGRGDDNPWGSLDPPLPVADLGDSDALHVGQFVVAVGSPGGLDNTVTMGIVSGLKRSSEEVGLMDKKVEFIQTDAAINMGNSGGPLVDVNSGTVVGINTCMRYNMEGTSFAIPNNTVRSIMSDLAEGRTFGHGYVGIQLYTLAPDMARDNNRDPNAEYGIVPEDVRGAIVARVFPGTPAQDAGLRRADVIVGIGGKRVEHAGDAYRIIDSSSVGEVSSFLYFSSANIFFSSLFALDPFGNNFAP